LLQIGVFSEPANVDRASTALAGAGALLVEPRLQSGRQLYRVRLGAWESREDAEAARRTIAQLGFPDAVVTAR
jgi:rare lipoprotein A